MTNQDSALLKLVWSDAFSVGVTEIDEQHKKLIAIINELVDCMAAPQREASDRYYAALSDLLDYTRDHFRDEEDYLQRMAYPELASHKEEHAAFVHRLVDDVMGAVSDAAHMSAVHRHVRAWLYSHILESDMNYRRFVEEGKPVR
jgi:hemerythrin